MGSDTRLAHRHSRACWPPFPAAKSSLLAEFLRVECAPRGCTSWSTAAAALIWPVCEFLAAGCWAAAQSSTGVTLIRRCAGLPMQHELLSPIARALTLLQHPSRHTCPHTLRQRWQTDVVCRQDLKLPLVFRAQVGSEATGPILCGDNATSVLQIREGVACFAVPGVLFVCALRGHVLCGVLLTFRARACAEGGQSRPVHIIDWSHPRG